MKRNLRFKKTKKRKHTMEAALTSDFLPSLTKTEGPLTCKAAFTYTKFGICIYIQRSAIVCCSLVDSLLWPSSPFASGAWTERQIPGSRFSRAISRLALDYVRQAADPEGDAANAVKNREVMLERHALHIRWTKNFVQSHGLVVTIARHFASHGFCCTS